MKSLSKFFTSFFPAIALIFLLSDSLLAQEMRVMSYNIRYKNTIDSINGWEYRKENVAALIRYHQADVVGVQEAQPDQMADLEKLLPEFAWYGVPRVEGKSGEYTAVFYRKNRFTLEGSGTFWMSETPDVKESKSWDAFHGPPPGVNSKTKPRKRRFSSSTPIWTIGVRSPGKKAPR